MSGQQYYSPYTGQESDSDTESDASTSSGFSDSAAQKLDDPRYAIIRAAGPALNTLSEQNFYQALESRRNQVIGYNFNEEETYVPSTDFPLRTPLLPFIPATTTTTTTLFSFNSSERDKNVWPLSTFFTLKTPRNYKNIINIQFVQINFPNFLNSVPDISSLYTSIAEYASQYTKLDFSGCYECLGNSGWNGGGKGFTTSLNGGSFSEQGRTNPVAPANPLVHAFTLRGGNYDPMALATEMDKQMNTTPPFNIISYSEHRQLFIATGNASHLFNEPGKWYYSPSSGNFMRNASKTVIINDYLPNVHLAAALATEKEIFVAYFFPVLKAAFHSTYDSKFLDLNSLSADFVRQRVLTTFEGLSSPLYYDLCYRNMNILKSIRRVHTFEYNPINSYNYTYSPANNKMVETHTELHPSLMKDIQTFQESSHAQAAEDAGYAGRSLLSLQSSISSTGSIVSDLAKQIQTSLVEVGIPLYTYTHTALANPETPVFLQSKKNLTTSQMNESDEALIAMTLGPVSLSPPITTNRSFPASFGWATLQQLTVDATNAKTAVAGSRAYTAPYLQQLHALNEASALTRAGSFPNRAMSGLSVNCTDFPSLYSTFTNYYSTNMGLLTVANTIQSRALNATNAYVSKKYKTVLPTALLENNAFLNGQSTGGVTFYSSKSIHYPSTPDDVNNRNFRDATKDTSACCSYVTSIVNNFYGCLPAEYVITTPFYQMGYGIDNIFSFYSTNTLAKTTISNNIYIQLNPEQSLNNMDIGGTENYNITNESTGQYKKVFGKILIQGLTAGQVAQTIIQAPARFPISPLASLDHFSFNFFLDTMVPVNQLYPFVLSGTDWNAIIQIDEQVAALGTS